MKKLLSIILLSVIASGCSTKPSNDAANLEDAPPKLIHEVLPIHPFELFKAGISGYAEIGFTVSKTGDVVEAHVVSATHPDFGRAALSAIMKSKYTIPIKNGQPVMARMRVPVTFDLKQKR
jgi:TonB family protein